ncbi:MAG: hypothetical protein KJ579_00065, partial [Verrucomicrobia bacterium]|nr:hypothetical protein [Verrucomicrobiota bacterium]
SGTVGMSLRQQPRRLTVHLVNHQRDSRCESDAVTPVDRIALRIRVPGDAKIRAVRRLFETRELPFQVIDGVIRTDIGRLDEYEAVAVEW